MSTLLTFVSLFFYFPTSTLTHENQFFDDKDSVFFYWDTNYEIERFDTLVDHVKYEMETFCLNDSSVFNETISAYRKPGTIEFSVAHNFITHVKIRRNEEEVEVYVEKESFSDSISSDFMRICYMRKNIFQCVRGEQLFCKATLSKPDTGFQLGVFYRIGREGKIVIIKVVDESYYGSED